MPVSFAALEPPNLSVPEQSDIVSGQLNEPTAYRLSGGDVIELAGAMRRFRLDS